MDMGEAMEMAGPPMVNWLLRGVVGAGAAAALAAGGAWGEMGGSGGRWGGLEGSQRGGWVWGGVTLDDACAHDGAHPGVSVVHDAGVGCGGRGGGGAG